MGEAYKVLGQVAPSANALTVLYTVPVATATVVSTVVVCNQTNGVAHFRLSVAVAGAADTTKQYLFYDTSILTNSTGTFTLGLTLGAGDVLRVQTDGATVSFSAFGSEVS